MAYHAKIENGIVTQVIVTMDSDQDTFAARMLAETGEQWELTSESGQFRKNYAGIGYTFDPVRDAFYAPKPFDSWVLDDKICQWIPPKPYPLDVKDYHWDESKLDWVEN